MIRTAIVLTAAAAFAISAEAGPFDGTWKIDTSTFKPSGKSIDRLLANGHYHCTCSNPPEDFPADGKFHRVTGHPDYDEAMGEAVDAHTVRLAYRLKGKDIENDTLKLSDDGNTITVDWTDTSAAKPVTGTSESVRVAAAPAGAHAVSGSWKSSGKMKISDDGSIVRIAQTGKQLRFSGQDGTSYTATLGGPYVPVEGNKMGQRVKLVSQGPNTVASTEMTAGKVTSRGLWTVSADGSTMHLAFTDVATGRTTEMDAKKQ